MGCVCFGPCRIRLKSATGQLISPVADAVIANRLFCLNNRSVIHETAWKDVYLLISFTTDSANQMRQFNPAESMDSGHALCGILFVLITKCASHSAGKLSWTLSDRPRVTLFSTECPETNNVKSY